MTNQGMEADAKLVNIDFCPSTTTAISQRNTVQYMVEESQLIAAPVLVSQLPDMLSPRKPIYFVIDLNL